MKISFPHMGNYYPAFESLMEKLGCQALVPPPITKKTIELGTRYAPEFACLPFKINLGNFIEALNLGTDVLFQAGRRGPCRYGFYGEVQREILQNLGYNFRLQELFPGNSLFSFIKGLKGLNPDVTFSQILRAALITIKKINLIDEMEHLRRKLRAYEIKKGEVDGVFEKALKWLEEAKNLKELKGTRKRILKRFKAIKRDETKSPLKIAIVGELYIVMEPFANLDIEKKLGEMGVEVYRPLCLSEIIRQAVFFWEYRNVTRKGKEFIDYELGAHGGHSIGRTVEFSKSNFEGIIHIYPLGCLPEVSARTILDNVREKLDIPLLHLSFDEQTGEAGMQTRLEAFIEMLERKRIILLSPVPVGRG